MQIAGFGVGGIALGVAYFASLRRVAEIYAQGHVRWRGVVLHLARIVFLVGALIGAATFGALPLLAAAGGILIGRVIVMAREKTLA
jgi:hypothetical protein